MGLAEGNGQLEFVNEGLAIRRIRFPNRLSPCFIDPDRAQTLSPLSEWSHRSSRRPEDVFSKGHIERGVEFHRFFRQGRQRAHSPRWRN